MTGKTFQRYVYLTIAALLIASLATLAAGVHYAGYADASRTAVPVYIAMAAGWLTFCLQRRVAYTNALRALWERMVDTIQDAIRYTAQTVRTEEEYGLLVRELSCRIDEVRGVFRNVDESYQPPTDVTKEFVYAVKHSQKMAQLEELVRNYPDDTRTRGLYPFESLKQIQGVIEKLGHSSAATAAEAKTASKTILILWRILRAELLKELDRDYPEFPDTPYKVAASSGWRRRHRDQRWLETLRSRRNPAP